MPTEPSASPSPAHSGGLTRLELTRQRIAYAVALLDLRGRGLVLIGSLLALAWAVAGIYKVQPDEQGIVLRFGRWLDTTEPGLHYHLPFPSTPCSCPR